VLTIPSQLKVFTAPTGGTQVSSGAVFARCQPADGSVVEGATVSTSMMDAKLTVAIQGHSDVSDYANFTVLWAQLQSQYSANTSYTTIESAWLDMVDEPKSQLELVGGTGLRYGHWLG